MGVLNQAIADLPDTTKERHTLEALLITGMSADEKINLVRMCQEIGAERSTLVRAFIALGIQNYNNHKSANGGALNFKKEK